MFTFIELLQLNNGYISAHAHVFKFTDRIQKNRAELLAHAAWTHRDPADRTKGPKKKEKCDRTFSLIVRGKKKTVETF